MVERETAFNFIILAIICGAIVFAILSYVAILNINTTLTPLILIIMISFMSLLRPHT